MPRIAVNMVTWNSRKFLPEALASLELQTWRDFYVLVIDNGSTDGTVEYIRAHHPKVFVLRNTRNLGFARAHNQGVIHAKAHLKSDDGDPFVLVTNPDIVLEADFLERLVSQVDRRPKVGAACGKLLKARQVGEGELTETVNTGLIDSTGLVMKRSLWASDRGAGEIDRGQYDRIEEVFGATGALALYRLAALEDVAFGQEVFDEDFFMYKEDVDLAWRLRRRGWETLYVPQAKALHFRSASGHGRFSIWQSFKAHNRRSMLIERWSLRNQFLMSFKNERIVDFLRHLPWILFFETGKLGYVALFKPRALSGVLDGWRLLPKAWRKRREIMRRAVTKPAAVREWFR